MLSIVSISYNHEKYLDTWHQGIISQNIQGIQVVYVNDASTDNSWEKFQSLKWPADIKVTARCHEKNLGGPATLTEALALASEPYIALLETDDYYLPAKLEKSMAKLGEGLDAVCTEISAVLPCGTWVDRGWHNIGVHVPEVITQEYLAIHNPVYTCTFMARRELFEKCPSPQEFAKEFGVLGDYPGYAWMAKRYRLGYLNEPLSVYREGTGVAHQNRAAIQEADHKVKEWIRAGKL